MTAGVAAGTVGLGVLLLSRLGEAKPPDDYLAQLFRSESMCSGLITVLPPADVELARFRAECMPSGLVICSPARIVEYAESKLLSRIWWHLTRDERFAVSTVLIDLIPQYFDHVCYEGIPGCVGCGTGRLETGWCVNNAIMRWAVFSGSPLFPSLASCYYKRKTDAEWNCFLYAAPYNLPCYLVSMDNPRHSIAGLQIGDDVREFSSWRFFQYDNNDIKPGDWQMKYDCNVEIHIPDHIECGGYWTVLRIVEFYIDEDGVVSVA